MTSTKVTLKKSTNEYDEQIYIVLCDGVEIGSVKKDDGYGDGRDWQNDAQQGDFWTRREAIAGLIWATTAR
jgi:hypothetical protein|tara:strand:- start:851 stop:1063 length:213 start_codon:yes stop_codon:yes gene_type:complete